MSRAVGWLFNAQDELRTGWKVLGFFLAFALLLIPVQGLLLMLDPSGQSRWLRGVQPWILGAAALLVTVLFCRWEGVRWRTVGLDLDKRWWKEALVGTVLGTGLIVATALTARLLGGFHWERVSTIPVGMVLTYTLLFVGVAFSEELLFRGYAFQRLCRGIGVGATQALFALLFAWMHWGNPNMSGSARLWGTLNIALAAILLGAAYLRTSRLALPVGIHFGWNTMQALLGFGVSGTHDMPGLLTVVHAKGPAWISGGAFGLEGSLPCAGVCLAFIVALLWLPRRAAS